MNGYAPTLVWPRWVEQRGGLLTTAGTVEPGIFACVTRPGRLVKDSMLGAGVSADPGVASDFPRVCAGAARCLYPDFAVSRGYRCRHVLAVDRWRRAWDHPQLGGTATAQSVKPSPRRQRDTSRDAVAGRPERDPWRRGPYRTQERRGGADWCLDTTEGRPIAPGPPESGKEPF